MISIGGNMIAHLPASAMTPGRHRDSPVIKRASQMFMRYDGIEITQTGANVTWTFMYRGRGVARQTVQANVNFCGQKLSMTDIEGQIEIKRMSS